MDATLTFTSKINSTKSPKNIYTKLSCKIDFNCTNIYSIIIIIDSISKKSR